MQLGRLGAIWRYPIKSLAGESLESSAVLPNGLEGDRERALLVRDGHARAGKAYRGKENDRLHTMRDTAHALEAARERGVVADVATDHDERFFDLSPISIVLDRWLDGISEHVGYRVEYRRFRPNLFVLADGDVPDEAELPGRELTLGPVRLRVVKAIERCVVTNYALDGGAADARILRYVAQERENCMGIYCDVLRAGTVRIGDSLALVER